MSPPLRPYRVPLRKRLLDLLLTLLAMLVLSPVILLTALAVWVLEGRPVFFRQPRPGLGGKIFTVIKFRTMRGGTFPDGHPLPEWIWPIAGFRMAVTPIGSRRQSTQRRSGHLRS